ncbi:hypothetical protein [Streptomyces sp. CRN 30]|uniref:hypothetical protein n=1 Tax=Streptomyces sp. CRN 30 TaxID=3075613 RepID=UPI002A7EAFAF|nr:hypothetical protein [Streptomyces sp. CRN 30]
MADEQYRWLDRRAAERLLRGEPLEAVETADAAGAAGAVGTAGAVDGEGRDVAGRLARTLAALTPDAPRTDAELPGEQAALTAFRTARVTPEGAAAGPAPRRSRWVRPLRLGMVAGLAAGMLGGVAVGVGTGTLPTPFQGGPPRPAASVTGAQVPERPLMSPSPSSGDSGDSGEVPDGGRGAVGGTGSSGERSGESLPEDPTGGDKAGQPDSGDPGERGHSREWWSAVRSACRDVDRGRSLDTGRLRDLEDAAGGPGPDRVRKYCDRVLSGSGGADAPKASDGDGSRGNHVRRGQDGEGPDRHGSDGNGTYMGDGGGDGAGGGGDRGGKGDGDGDGDEGPGIPGGGNGHGHHGDGRYGSDRHSADRRSDDRRGSGRHGTDRRGGDPRGTGHRGHDARAADAPLTT